MKTTIFFVELIYAIIQDVNINNTKVYLHGNIELMILQKKTKPGNIFFLFRKNKTNLDRVKIKYEKIYQMVIVPMDLNNPMDNLDVNYPLLKVIKDAIVD
jgi:hypothetical protein